MSKRFRRLLGPSFAALLLVPAIAVASPADAQSRFEEDRPGAGMSQLETQHEPRVRDGRRESRPDPARQRPARTETRQHRPAPPDVSSAPDRRNFRGRIDAGAIRQQHERQADRAVQRDRHRETSRETQTDRHWQNRERSRQHDGTRQRDWEAGSATGHRRDSQNRREHYSHRDRYERRDRYDRRDHYDRDESGDRDYRRGRHHRPGVHDHRRREYAHQRRNFYRDRARLRAQMRYVHHMNRGWSNTRYYGRYGSSDRWRYDNRYYRYGYDRRQFSYYDGLCRYERNGEGVVIGALLGALVGGAIADSDHTGAGILLGAGFGAALGSSVGNLDQCDRAQYHYAMNYAFEHGDPYYWANPHTGVRGTVVVRETYYMSGQECRMGDAEIYMPDGTYTYDRVRMCRDAYGDWQVARHQ